MSEHPDGWEPREIELEDLIRTFSARTPSPQAIPQGDASAPKEGNG